MADLFEQQHQDAFEDDFPDFIDGIAKLQLQCALPKDVYKGFRKSPELFLKAIELTEKNPRLQRAVVESAPHLLYGIKPEKRFELLKAVKDKPFVAPIVLATTDEFPYVALQNLQHFEDTPYTKRMFEIIIDKGFFMPYYLNQYNKPYYGEILEKAFRKYAEENPMHVFFNVKLIEGKPYAEEVIEKAARTALKIDCRAILYHRKVLETKPYFQEIFEAALRRLVQEAPYDVILHYYSSTYTDFPLAEEIFEKAVRNLAKRNPWRAVEIYALYQNKPYADEVKNEADRIIETADRKSALFVRPIDEYDFPIDEKTFDLYILGINHELVRLGYELINIPLDAFRRILYCQPFQNILRRYVRRISWMNAFSLAQGTYESLKAQGMQDAEMTDQRIQEIAEKMMNGMDRVRNRELFGPNTKLILFTHEEAQFDNDFILERLYFKRGGRKENTVSAKGVRLDKNGKNIEKERTLEAIRRSKGSTTVLFSGHGSPENWGFARNQSFALNRNLDPSPDTINYRELGDALMVSGNMENMHLIGATCYAYDYFMNLFKYLRERGCKQQPYVSISAANKAKPAYGFDPFSKQEIINDVFLNAVDQVTLAEGRSQAPIVVDDVFKAESQVWRKTDPEVFIGTPSGTH
ncbi:hypothetical protein HYW83_05795 [Candidatus Peregrinibacteria bacterium]|nr:hypothetical protein [Candidatus Peregrinibacteria bacterium]